MTYLIIKMFTREEALLLAEKMRDDGYTCEIEYHRLEPHDFTGMSQRRDWELQAEKNDGRGSRAGYLKFAERLRRLEK